MNKNSNYYNRYTLLTLLLVALLSLVGCHKSATSSPITQLPVKTPNPSVSIKLDKIGVYDNREDLLRGQDGEVYVYVVVYDGKNPTRQLRFPKAEGQYFKLPKDGTAEVNALVFSADEVGNNLGLTIIGFEDDGSGYEPLVYKALGAAIEYQLAAHTLGLSEAFNLNLAGLVGKFTGEADDYLGTFERTWDKSNNWGVGTYPDVSAKDERGTQCLRLWFSISSK